jgi:hypothetical protein
MVRRCVADGEKSCMLLVMRTLSIVPLNFKVCFYVRRARCNYGVTIVELI